VGPACQPHGHLPLLASIVVRSSPGAHLHRALLLPAALPPCISLVSRQCCCLVLPCCLLLAEQLHAAAATADLAAAATQAAPSHRGCCCRHAQAAAADAAGSRRHRRGSILPHGAAAERHSHGAVTVETWFPTSVGSDAVAST
jgi:hypothetical protein